MPQLNPAPWFLILLFSWLIFLTIVSSKVVAHTTPNDPVTQGAHVLQKTIWLWPWS
uniref:ATP synthase F0 subunit 8 n=1 Tax=Monolene sessilicauda TaxID=1266886 RepID=UPI0028FCBF35|nr:ATP synthase F0 subunit 8 [Monolene sessilicauda]WNH37916.1 ATP synthase F0 subunit 8 [Monolene sessilicauda]